MFSWNNRLTLFIFEENYLPKFKVGLITVSLSLIQAKMVPKERAATSAQLKTTTWVLVQMCAGPPLHFSTQQKHFTVSLRILPRCILEWQGLIKLIIFTLFIKNSLKWNGLSLNCKCRAIENTVRGPSFSLPMLWTTTASVNTVTKANDVSLLAMKIVLISQTPWKHLGEPWGLHRPHPENC